MALNLMPVLQSLWAVRTMNAEVEVEAEAGERLSSAHVVSSEAAEVAIERLLVGPDGWQAREVVLAEEETHGSEEAAVLSLSLEPEREEGLPVYEHYLMVHQVASYPVEVEVPDQSCSTFVRSRFLVLKCWMVRYVRTCQRRQSVVVRGTSTQEETLVSVARAPVLAKTVAGWHLVASSLLAEEREEVLFSMLQLGYRCVAG